jgi:hypothetical protein
MIQRLKQRWLRDRRLRAAYLVLMMVLFVAGWLTLPVWSADEKTPAPAAEKAAAEKPAAAAPAAPAPGAVPPTPVVPDAGKPAEHAKPKLFAPLTSFPWGERIALVLVLGVAIAGLVYAGMLVKQVREADQGTPKMQEIASAVREGADAYLWAQFRKIGPLIVLITIGLYFSKRGGEEIFAWGRAGAFLVGSLFSWTVGFVGMKLATTGNLRVAAAAKRSYGEAMQLGYRTGTITGMLTDGLGLLGGTCIFLIYGEQAYEALLGFGFGGTLLALFMRVGGGIYTKAADVGADLVGKVEAGIPEDDPRNAATIADNVGDNVGDCAGMAADIFESYEVTIVAAMILGLASFGHKGVIFPLLVRGIGVLGSIISTYTVKAGPNDTSDTALKSVHRGFWIGSLISICRVLPHRPVLPALRPGLLQGVPDGGLGLPGQRPGRLARLGELRHVGPRHAARLDLPHRRVPRDRPEQGHQLLHPHLAQPGQDAGAKLPDRPRDEHHSGVRRGVREHGGGAVGDCRGHRPLGALLLGHSPRVHRLRRGHDRHRHAHPDRQHDLDGRFRPRGRQRQRHRRDGLRQGRDGRRVLQAGPADPGRPRRRGQHHEGRDQGHRHRLGRDRGRLALRQLHRGDRRR